MHQISHMIFFYKNSCVKFDEFIRRNGSFIFISKESSQKRKLIGHRSLAIGDTEIKFLITAEILITTNKEKIKKVKLQ